MPAFAPGQVHVTVEPFIHVDPLPPGTYRFKLEVVDAAGNVSAPVEHTLTVTAPPQPQPQPQPQPTGPVVRPGGTIGRIPIQPVVEEVEKITRIPIFKRPNPF
jgi:hypothetical protein